SLHVLLFLSVLYYQSSTYTYSFSLFLSSSRHPRDLHSFPTRRSSDLCRSPRETRTPPHLRRGRRGGRRHRRRRASSRRRGSRLRSEEHTSELQSPDHLVCRLLLEKKKKKKQKNTKNKRQHNKRQ